MLIDTESLENTFFDIHCHTMNLSHPSLYAFLKRFLKIPHNPVFAMAGGAVIGGTVGLLAPFFGGGIGRKFLNHLSIMERNVSRILMAMEDDFPNPISIGEKEFKGLTIAPLLMDFWADEEAEKIYYPFTPKSIIPQILDVLNGIADYANTVRGVEYDECIKEFSEVSKWGRQIGAKKQWRLDLRRLTTSNRDSILDKYGPKKRKLMALPFLGLNTRYCYLKTKKRKSHESTDLPLLLEKYFVGNANEPYTGTLEGLSGKFGCFQGNLRKIGGDYFLGIKVYPPLGFDPWPENEKDELEKVEHLYSFCEENQIPIVSHCSDGGFKVGDPQAAVERSHPKKWSSVLHKYGKLRLNIAHFGGQNSGLRYTESWWNMPYRKLMFGGDPEWAAVIIELMKGYGNVYSDISYSGVNDKYYHSFLEIIEKNYEIENKVLFGSDFTINLLSINSYRKYIENFLNTKHLSDSLKIKLCNTNPRNFLFNK